MLYVVTSKNNRKKIVHIPNNFYITEKSKEKMFKENFNSKKVMCVTAKQLTLNFLSYRDDILLVDDSSTKGGKIFGFVNFCLPRVIVVIVFLV